jgi:hypothetical protein
MKTRVMKRKEKYHRFIALFVFFALIDNIKDDTEKRQVPYSLLKACIPELVKKSSQF